MTPIEAYELALEKVEELKEAGIEVIVRPKISASSYIEEPNGIPPDKWVLVTFKFSHKIQAEKVHEAANYLGMCGMRFDVGGTKEYRDWELDWSFQYTGKEDEEWRDARDEIEDRINA